MQFNQLPVLLTMTYERAQLGTDSVELYSSLTTARTETTLYSWIVAGCILYIMYAFMYVSFWYIDKYMNPTKLRLFRLITLGRSSADEVDAVSAILFSILAVFVILLVISGVANVLIIKLYELLLGG